MDIGYAHIHVHGHMYIYNAACLSIVHVHCTCTSYQLHRIISEYIGVTQACTKVYTRSIKSSRVLLQDVLKEPTWLIVIMLLSVSLFPWKTVICVRGRQSGRGGEERGGEERGGEGQKEGERGD